MSHNPTLRLAAAGLLSFCALLSACSEQEAPGFMVAEDLAATDAGSDSEARLLAILDPLLPPSGNFDLSHWKLTLPSGSEIQTAQLLDGYQKSGAFYTDPLTGGMVFKCWNLAGTTANSSYSRSELREMLTPSGPASADANNWTMEEGGVLKATLRVDRVSKTGDASKMGRVVIGQIHGDDSEVIRLYYVKKPTEATGRIYAGMDSVDNKTTWSPDIVSNANRGGIPVGEKFSYEIRLTGTTLRVTITRASGVTHSYVRSIDARYAGENLYFKAGVYNQNNTGESTDYVKATFFALRAAHP